MQFDIFQDNALEEILMKNIEIMLMNQIEYFKNLPMNLNTVSNDLENMLTDEIEKIGKPYVNSKKSAIPIQFCEIIIHVLSENEDEFKYEHCISTKNPELIAGLFLSFQQAYKKSNVPKGQDFVAFTNVIFSAVAIFIHEWSEKKNLDKEFIRNFFDLIINFYNGELFMVYEKFYNHFIHTVINKQRIQNNSQYH